MKFEFDSVITLAMNDGHIPQSVQSFLLEDFGSSVPGSFRLRVKIHKTPMGARPVMNMSKSWLTCAGAYFKRGAVQLELCG